MNVSGGMALRILLKGSWNLVRKNPLSVSFEITHSCTANCWHCNWGGQIKETRRTPEEYAAIYREIDPVIVNVSGGEPMTRHDLDDVVRAFARPGRLPWIVVISNASQLTEERFRRLKAAGMHQLSLSIDFPDDRHSEFRRIPGLFARMNEMVPKCVAIGDEGDVSLNCCITAWNYRDLPDIVRLATRWGVSVNFSAYSTLRMDDPRGLVKNNGSPEELKEKIEEVIEMKHQGYPVYTSDRVLRKFGDFLVTAKAPGCQAGYKFLVVAPDGRLTPCATVMAYYDDHRTMQREFSDHNTCEACFISTRANTEKTFTETLADNAETLRQLLPWSRTAKPRLPLPVETTTTRGGPMTRQCPSCHKELPAFTVRCSCGAELAEARDRRSIPDHPSCNVCGAALALMTETCPACGADGYPALRSRKGKKSLGSVEPQ